MDSMYHHPMDTRGMGGGSMNGKGLIVSISEDHRSISPSPQPGSQPMAMMGSSSSSMMMGGGSGMGGAGMGGNGGGGDDSPYLQEDSSGEGEQPSQFGRAKKPKRKAAPRTSRACLACRRQKMRCEGAENPPCRRCVQNEVDCMFERRSDYLLNPEDRAWQNGVEKRLEHLSRTIDMILAHLGGGPAALPPMPTTAAAFPEMPPAAGYFESYERHGVPQTAPPVGPGGPGAGGSQGDGRINYVVPSPAETAAIAAQARMKRGRGNTMPSPSNMPSAGFGPDTAFQLFSPRTAALDANGGLPNPYSFGGPPMPNSAHPHQHPHMQSQQHDHSHLHGHAHHGHPHELGGHHGGSHTPGPPPGSSAGPGGLQYSHAYSFDTAYPGPSPALGGPSYSNGPGQAGVQGGSGTPSGSMSGPSGSGAGLVGSSSDLVPRSLGSPAGTEVA